MREKAWFALFDQTWPRMKDWLNNTEITQGTINRLEQRGYNGFALYLRGFVGQYMYNAIEATRALGYKNMLWYFMQTIWEDAPDRPYIHQWNGWHDFCDLCSEGMELDKEEA